MQSFKEIQGQDNIKNSRTVINDSIKTVMSNHSGTAFPTTNLQVGMKCYRTDLGKTYTLTNVANKTWTEDNHATLADSANKLSGYTLSTAGSTNTWEKIPSVGKDGVMEIGKYIDFHSKNNDGKDYSTRITANDDGSLSFSGTIHATLSGNASSASSVPWSGVTGKPSTYAPAAHNHDSSYPSTSGARASGTWGINITGSARLDTSGAEFGSRYFIRNHGACGNIDNTSTEGIYIYAPETAGTKPTSGWGRLVVYNTNLAGFSSACVYQIAYGTNGLIYHRCAINTGKWTAWQRAAFVTDKVANATKADTATNVTQRKSARSVTHADYANNQAYLPDMSFMAFWNGAYNSSGNSNLKYSANGQIIGSSNIGSQSVKYATSAGSANAVAWGNVSSKPTGIVKVSSWDGSTLSLTTCT